jgi:hypothetical protein
MCVLVFTGAAAAAGSSVNLSMLVLLSSTASLCATVASATLDDVVLCAIDSTITMFCL